MYNTSLLFELNRCRLYPCRVAGDGYNYEALYANLEVIVWENQIQRLADIDQAFGTTSLRNRCGVEPFLSGLGGEFTWPP